jgi:3-hydroxyisobutyrate dehydrogenase
MRVGFIGVGTMGGPMVRNLLEAGHEVLVNDANRAAAEPLFDLGARWAGSAREAASGVELVLTSLPGPREVELVALGDDGIIHGAERGSVYADLSTSSPTLIRRIHAAFAERGVEVIDAPVSGGPSGAQRGTLQVMVGGDEAVFERVRPTLLAIGDKVSLMGEIGCGSIAKLVHNTIGYCTLQAFAETFTLGVKAGVKPEKLLEAVRGGAFGQHNLINNRMPNIVFKGAFDTPNFALRLARKDVGLATELGREFEVPMAVANLVEQQLIEGLVRGWGAKDSSSVFMLQEGRAGVTVRAEPD